MAETKKATAKVIAKAAPAKTVEVKKEEVKEAVKAATPAAEVKAPEKAAPAKAVEKKAAEKKAPAKKAVAEKKAPAKKAATEKKAPAKKAAVKVQESVNFQFSGKSYTDADLLKICRDVWKYDLNGKEEDLKTVELYVKPEENTTYYVINGSITGSFFI